MVAAALLLFVPTSSAATPCAPGLGVGLVDVPAGTKDPRAQNYIVDHVKPGAQFSRRYQVCNGTARPIAVQLYAGAATLTGGAFRITEGRAVNELASWVTVEPSRSVLQPGQRLLAKATFAVPKDAEEGERYGVLLAEFPPVRNASGFPVASRIGVRVYLDVGPGGAPHSDFRVDSLQAARDADGDATVTAAVHNTGKRALDMSGSLMLRNGPGGLSGGPYAATLGTTLAPGDTEPVVVAVGRDIAAGPWSARLTLKSGFLERTVDASLTFPVAAGVKAAPVDVEQLPVQSDEAISFVPLLWTALAAGAVGALALGWRRVSRRAPASPPPSPR